MDKDKIKEMIVVGFSVVAFILLFVAIVTDYWVSYYTGPNTINHEGLFFKGKKISFYVWLYIIIKLIKNFCLNNFLLVSINTDSAEQKET